MHYPLTGWESPWRSAPAACSRHPAGSRGGPRICGRAGRSSSPTRSAPQTSPMSRQGKGTPTLATVIDRFSRYIVSWRPFDTMRAKEIVACARQAFTKHVTLSIMNFEQRGVFGSDTYAFTARLHACGAEPEQKGSDGGTTPSCKGGSARSRANACGRRNTAHLQSLRVTTEKFVTWYNEERI